MKNSRIAIIVFVLLALAIAGTILFLANSSIKPPAQTVEQKLPDDRIPR